MDSKDKNLKILTLFIALFILLVGILLIIPDNTNANDSKIEWYSYEDGLAVANAENKSAMLYFHTDWCTWCDKMDADTFSNDDVVDESKNFVTIKIDGDNRGDLVDKYKVSGYPTVVFIDANGSTTNKVDGYQSPNQFIASMGGENPGDNVFVCSLTSSWVNVFILILLPIVLIITLFILERRKDQLSVQTEKKDNKNKFQK